MAPAKFLIVNFSNYKNINLRKFAPPPPPPPFPPGPNGTTRRNITDEIIVVAARVET